MLGGSIKRGSTVLLLAVYMARCLQPGAWVSRVGLWTRGGPFQPDQCVIGTWELMGNWYVYINRVQSPKQQVALVKEESRETGYFRQTSSLQRKMR